MTLKSSVFEDEGVIPSKYTCDGENINPPFYISDVPDDAKSLVLIMEDPDVSKKFRPDGIFDHWVVFNMPASTISIDEGQDAPGIYGSNTSGKAQYTGPCPPDREHRYIFSLYALDTDLSLETGAMKKDVLEAMEGHSLAETELVGRYNRKK
jgi:Raf kinase inhibitor-like YbhB/YbcL family protein